MLKRVNELTAYEAGVICIKHKNCATCPLNFDEGKCYRDIILAKTDYEEKMTKLTDVMKRISYDERKIIKIDNDSTKSMKKE